MPLTFLAAFGCYFALGFMVWLTFFINRENVHNILMSAREFLPGFKERFDELAPPVESGELLKPPKLGLVLFTWPALVGVFIVIGRLVKKSRRSLRSFSLQEFPTSNNGLFIVDTTELAAEEAKDLQQEVFDNTFGQEAVQMLADFYAVWRSCLPPTCQSISVPAFRPKLYVQMPESDNFLGFGRAVVASVSLHRRCTIASYGNHDVDTVIAMRFSFGANNGQFPERHEEVKPLTLDFLKNAIELQDTFDVIWSRAEDGIWTWEQINTDDTKDIHIEGAMLNLVYAMDDKFAESLDDAKA